MVFHLYAPGGEFVGFYWRRNGCRIKSIGNLERCVLVVREVGGQFLRINVACRWNIRVFGAGWWDHFCDGFAGELLDSQIV